MAVVACNSVRDDTNGASSNGVTICLIDGTIYLSEWFCHRLSNSLFNFSCVLWFCSCTNLSGNVVPESSEAHLFPPFQFEYSNTKWRYMYFCHNTRNKHKSTLTVPIISLDCWQLSKQNPRRKIPSTKSSSSEHRGTSLKMRVVFSCVCCWYFTSSLYSDCFTLHWFWWWRELGVYYRLLIIECKDQQGLGWAQTCVKRV